MSHPPLLRCARAGRAQDVHEGMQHAGVLTNACIKSIMKACSPAPFMKPTLPPRCARAGCAQDVHPGDCRRAAHRDHRVNTRAGLAKHLTPHAACRVIAGEGFIGGRCAVSSGARPRRGGATHLRHPLTACERNPPFKRTGMPSAPLASCKPPAYFESGCVTPAFYVFAAAVQQPG